MADPSATEFATELRPALRRAAELARSCEGRVPNEPKLGESTAVKQALTVGDTGAQEAILEALHSLFPDVCLAAEEDTPSVPLFPDSGDAVVVIDPIDGTLLSYLGGGGPYAVIVGLVIRDVYEAALVALPREGLFFDAAVGQGAFMGRAGGPPRAARLSERGSRVLVSHGTPEKVVQELRDVGLEPVSSCGGAVSLAPLIPGVRAGLRFVPAKNGISIRGRVGALIAREAGAIVEGRGGTPFPSDMQSPAPALLVAADPADIALLDRALDAISR